MDGKNTLTLTVGIPTCYGGQSLLDTARTLRASTGVGDFRFIIMADRTPIPPEIKNELEHLRVELFWNETAGSQMKKTKKMIAMVQSDILVLTQDDITFLPNTLSEILRTFEANPELTMLGARFLPLEPVTFFESAMASLVRMVDYIGMGWNGKDNYLQASGRCLAFRTEQIKKFDIPENLVNSDTFMYVSNRKLGGSFARPDNAIVYIRCPQRMRDQIGPSSRYQYSKVEMIGYFGKEIAAEYKIPLLSLFAGFTQEFLRHPISVISYTGVFIYTRIRRQQKSKVVNPIWAVDASTKNVEDHAV